MLTAFTSFALTCRSPLDDPELLPEDHSIFAEPEAKRRAREGLEAELQPHPPCGVLIRYRYLPTMEVARYPNIAPDKAPFYQVVHGHPLYTPIWQRAHIRRRLYPCHPPAREVVVASGSELKFGRRLYYYPTE